MSKSKHVAEAGHRYKHGAPKGNWPTFGPDGKIVRETPPEEPCFACGYLGISGTCPFPKDRALQAEPCPRCSGVGLVSIGPGIRGVKDCPRCRPAGAR